MAYKFQLGPTTLSGSLTVAGPIQSALSASGATTNISASGLIDGRNLSTDLCDNIAGSGLVRSVNTIAVGAGSLIDVNDDDIAVDLTEAASATIADGDFLIFLDGGTSGAESKGDTSDLASLLGGAGLAVTNSTLAVVSATNGGLSVAADDITVDLDDFAAAAVDVANDSFAIIDANDSNLSKKESIADLVGAIAGTVTTTALADSSGVLALDINNLNAEVIATGDTIVFNDDGDDGLHKETVDDLFKIGPALVTEAAIAVEDDYIVFLDGGASGEAKKEAVSDVVTALAGPGLGATGGVLELDLSELSDAAVASGDKFAFVDANDSNASKVESIDDIATFLAGTVGNSALAASSGVLTLDIANVTAAAIASTDTLLFNDQNGDVVRQETIDDIATLFAGTGLTAASAVMALDIANLSAETIATGDAIAFNDSGDDGVHKVTFDNMITKSPALLTEASIAAADYVMFLDGGATGDGKKESLADFATFLAGSNGLKAASSVLALDMDSLTAAAVDVANDSIAIVDANDSNASKKESIADLASAMAGTGVTATNGVFSVDTSGGDSMSSTAAAWGVTLTAGMNYFTASVIDPNQGYIEINLPEASAPTVGDTYFVKAPSNCGVNNRIHIEVSGTHKMDGETQIILNDPYATVGFVYTVSGSWSII